MWLTGWEIPIEDFSVAMATLPTGLLPPYMEVNHSGSSITLAQVGCWLQLTLSTTKVARSCQLTPNCWRAPDIGEALLCRHPQELKFMCPVSRVSLQKVVSMRQLAWMEIEQYSAKCIGLRAHKNAVAWVRVCYSNRSLSSGQHYWTVLKDRTPS